MLPTVVLNYLHKKFGIPLFYVTNKDWFIESEESCHLSKISK